MRLVCPNCDAQYEVDAGVIPDNGRDVQCSNCGHGWFQLPPEVEADIAAEEALYEPPPAMAASPVQNVPASLPRRSVDESVMSILREEAARETSARVSEGSGIETQTEMGLQNRPAKPIPAGAFDETPTSAAALRVSRLRGQAVEARIETAAESEPSKTQPKSDLLPEIDEINSSLRASSERRATEPEDEDPGLVEVAEEKVRAPGFRSGFVLMLVLAAVLLVVYILAEVLAKHIPGLAESLKTYVAMVDQLRVLVDTMLQGAVRFMDGLIGSQG